MGQHINFTRLGNYQVYKCNLLDKTKVIKIEEYSPAKIESSFGPATLHRQVRRSFHLVSELHRAVSSRGAAEPYPIWVPFGPLSSFDGGYKELISDMMSDPTGNGARLADELRAYWETRTTKIIAIADFLDLYDLKQPDPGVESDIRVHAILRRPEQWKELGRIIAVDLFTHNEDRFYPGGGDKKSEPNPHKVSVNGTNIFADKSGYIGSMDCFHTQATHQTALNLYEPKECEHWAGHCLRLLVKDRRHSDTYWGLASWTVVNALFKSHGQLHALLNSERNIYEAAFYDGLVDGRQKLIHCVSALSKRFTMDGSDNPDKKKTCAPKQLGLRADRIKG